MIRVLNTKNNIANESIATIVNVTYVCTLQQRVGQADNTCSSHMASSFRVIPTFLTIPPSGSYYSPQACPSFRHWYLHQYPLYLPHHQRTLLRLWQKGSHPSQQNCRKKLDAGNSLTFPHYLGNKFIVAMILQTTIPTITKLS